MASISGICKEYRHTTHMTANLSQVFRCGPTISYLLTNDLAMPWKFGSFEIPPMSAILIGSRLSLDVSSGLCSGANQTMSMATDKYFYQGPYDDNRRWSSVEHLKITASVPSGFTDDTGQTFDVSSSKYFECNAGTTYAVSGIIDIFELDKFTYQTLMFNGAPDSTSGYQRHYLGVSGMNCSFLTMKGVVPLIRICALAFVRTYTTRGPKRSSDFQWTCTRTVHKSDIGFVSSTDAIIIDRVTILPDSGPYYHEVQVRILRLTHEKPTTANSKGIYDLTIGTDVFPELISDTGWYWNEVVLVYSDEDRFYGPVKPSALVYHSTYLSSSKEVSSAPYYIKDIYNYFDVTTSEMMHCITEIFPSRVKFTSTVKPTWDVPKVLNQLVTLPMTGTLNHWEPDIVGTSGCYTSYVQLRLDGIGFPYRIQLSDCYSRRDSLSGAQIISGIVMNNIFVAKPTFPAILRRSYSSIIKSIFDGNLEELTDLYYESFNSLNSHEINLGEYVKDLPAFGAEVATIAKLIAAPNAKNFASAYLGYRYGSRLTVQDTKKLIEISKQYADNHRFLYESVLRRRSIKNDGYLATTALVENPNEDPFFTVWLGAKTSGLPVSLKTTWELIPTSFVADWLTDLSTVLNQADNFIVSLNLNIKRVLFTVKKTVNMNIYGYDCTVTVYKRTLMAHIDPPSCRSSTTSLSSKNIFTGACLLIQ